MRIVIDMQGAQSAASRNRGVGRYTLSLAQAIARNSGGHEVFLALNNLFPHTIESIRTTFDALIPQERIVTWQTPGPVADSNPENRWRREVGERLREAFLANLRPDIIHVPSLFEGFGDDALTSISTFETKLPTSVTLHDLIPLIYSDTYLTNPVKRCWYERKLGSLRRAQLWLTVSESSRREGITSLNLPEEWVVNVSEASDAMFHPMQFSAEDADTIRQRYGLARPFVMYTGGIDHRKNIEGLIKAYAKLSVSVRKRHQLVLVCSATEEQVNAFKHLAEQCGLACDELIMTGFIPDADMMALYNLCTAFVLPSWHEGFGLPALQAMSCGAAVIGANTSSLPELIGRDDALFNPHDENEITGKLHGVLIDGAFREQLKHHGLEQAKKFSWDNTAHRALEAFERLYACNQTTQIARIYIPSPPRPQLAYVSPVPPEKSGIAEYSAELLPELARHYNIDVIVNQPEVTDPWIHANCSIRSAEWFDENSHRYDRLLYHFGNSVFHQHMFQLLERHPGTVVLHDFFLSGVTCHMEMHGYAAGTWTAALYASHGYHAIKERFTAQDMASVVWKYPANLSILQQANGIIVHSFFSRNLAEKWYGEGSANDWVVVPLLRAPRHCFDRTEARRRLNLDDDDFVVCSFGVLGFHKLNHRLLSAWLASTLTRKANCVLIFVGENQGDAYSEELASRIRQTGKRIKITGWVDKPTFHRYLAAADVAVQLRTLSRGETSATVLDCMNYCLPVIVNANGSIANLPDNVVWRLPAEFVHGELVSALETLWTDPSYRQQLGMKAREMILTCHAPRSCADQYAEAIERFYRLNGTSVFALTEAVARVEPSPPETDAWVSLAESIAFSISPRIAPRQLFVDISELVQRDAKSGIQRVVRRILQEMLSHPPEGWRVEPVYATADQGYRYARRFTLRFLGCPDAVLVDDVIEFRAGDVFLGLDLQQDVVSAQQTFYQQLRNCGVKVFFVVYDILPITLPNAFPEGAAELHRSWLKVVGECDGVVCISEAVAAEVADWLKKNGPARQRPFEIKRFRLGADIAASCSSECAPDTVNEVLNTLAGCPTFLMVGTLEPRKGHAQTLVAFERLWADGIKTNLVIVGRQGWMVEGLTEKLRTHPFCGKRLHWLEGVSDEHLEKIYRGSSALLAASEGEGYGLPLIEAARYKLPIVARDIPVFREIASEHAFYFSGSPETMAAAIKEWLNLYAKGKEPRSDGIRWITWSRSAQQLMDVILNEKNREE